MSASLDPMIEPTKPTPRLCAHCGAPVSPDSPRLAQPTTNEAAAEDREYDRRGILLPQRTRVGGIIVPQ